MVSADPESHTETIERISRSTTAFASQLPMGDELLVDAALRRCCQETIARYAAHNPMVLCQECKHIIKVFSDPGGCLNYLAFCRSRRRRVQVAEYQGLQVVLFRDLAKLN